MISQATIDRIKNKRKKPEYYKVIHTLKSKYNIAIFSEHFFQQGKGSFGKCYLGKIMQKQGQKLQGHFFQDLVKNNEVIAIKILSKENRRNTKDIYQTQIKNLAKINNKNVVKVLPYTIESQKNYYMIMEYCNNCTLYELIQSRIKKKFTIWQFIQIMLDLINGYTGLKAAKIIHNDIKPQNILIQNKVFKIGDFGLSLKLNQQTNQIHYGTLPYASPQKLNPLADNQDIDHKSDIYSMGLILFQILYGRHPYYNKQSYEKFNYQEQQRIKNNNIKLNFTPKQLKLYILLKYIQRQAKNPIPRLNLQPFDKEYSSLMSRLQKIVQEMCHLDKKNRLSIEQVSLMLSQLAPQTIINQKDSKNKIRIDLKDIFNDLEDFSSSQFKFQLMKMSKYAFSMAEQNSIGKTYKSKSSQSSAMKRVQQTKDRLQAVFQLIRHLQSISEHLFQPSQDIQQDNFEEERKIFKQLMNNYLYSINLRELKFSFQQRASMNEQESKASDARQDITILIQKLYQNDFHLYDKVNISIENYSPDSHRQKLTEYIKNHLRNECIDRDNWSQTIAWILFYKFIQIQDRYRNNQNKIEMLNQMMENQQHFRLLHFQQLTDSDIREGDSLIRNNEKNFVYFYGEK